MPNEDSTDATSEAVVQRKRDWLELMVAIMLGLVSIGIAYASFQAALYDSQMAAAYQRGTALSAEAESLYLEGNQQYVRDAEVWNRLTELVVATESADPVTAANAQSAYDLLMFQAVSADMSAAIDWSNVQNEADPEVYYSPLDSEEYQATLFGAYADTKAEAERVVTEGNEHNSLSDRLTLFTVLMSVSLFLLGIASVVRQYRVQVLLAVSGTAIFAISVVLTAFVPFVGL